MAHEPLQLDQYYHIFNRGNNRENLFVQRRNYPYFLKLYTTHIVPVAETFAYCLMPNHFHFFVRTRTKEEQEAYWQQQQQIASFSRKVSISFKFCEPSRAFNNMFIAYARAFNRAVGRTGTLFESPFKRKNVDNDDYFLTLIVYIHRNPQYHGFVRDFREWTWSSYGAYQSNGPTKIKREEVLELFRNRQDFTDFHMQQIDTTTIAPVLFDEH